MDFGPKVVQHESRDFENYRFGAEDLGQNYEARFFQGKKQSFGGSESQEKNEMSKTGLP